MKYFFALNPQTPLVSIFLSWLMWWKNNQPISASHFLHHHGYVAHAPACPGPPLRWGTRCKLPRRYHRLSAPHNDDPLPEISALNLQSSIVQALLLWLQCRNTFYFFSLRLSISQFCLIPGLTFWLPLDNRTGFGSSDLIQSHASNVILLRR